MRPGGSQLTDEPGAACALCGRPTYDPDKREQPWARGVSRGRLVLICPTCQRDREGWPEMLDRCDACGSTRLSITLGQVLCRSCGHETAARRDPPESVDAP